MTRRYPIIGMTILAITCAGQALAADAAIGVSGFDFSPADVTINAGDKVTWTGLLPNHNVAESDSPASVVYNGTGFRSGAVGAVASFQQTFSSPGIFYFVCEPHAASFGMKGSVTVNAAAVPTSTAPGHAILIVVLIAASSFVLLRSARGGRRQA